MENKDSIQFNLNIKIIFHIYCFQEDIYGKNEIDYETPKNAQSSDNSIFFIKKDVMEKLKELFDYKTFCDIIKESNILDELKNKELGFNNYLFYQNADNTNILNDLNKQLEKYPDYVNKIKSLNIDKIIEELKKIDKKEWKDENVILNKGGLYEEIKIINEFEIINEYIYNLFLKGRNIGLLKGNYIFGGKKMLILIINTEDVKCLIGNLTRDGVFNSEYLVDINKMEMSEILMNNLIKIGIKNILEKIDEKKEVNIIENIMIYKIIIKNNNIIINNNIIHNYFENFENIKSEKIKALFLLSLYQKKNHEINDQKLSKVFCANGIYLKILEDIIKSNNKILNTINNISINDLSMNYFNEKIFNELGEKEKKEFSQIIENLQYEVNFNEISLISKNITLLTDFFFIHENLLKYFEQYFTKREIDLSFSHIFINQKDILIDHKQSLIFIIRKNNDFIYNIEYILDFKKFDLNIIEDFQNLEYENYINEQEVNNSISPIFLKDEIIGNCYKYKSDLKDYHNFIDYNKYFTNKVLINIVSLYANYKKINLKLKSKNNNQLKKYYLVNHEFINDTQIKYGYKQIYDSLQEKIENINISENDNKNIYYLLKCIPDDIFEQYKDKKIDEIKDSIIKLSIEPNIKPLNIYENNIQNESLNIYDNFEIIEQKILNKYVDNYENEKLVSECIFNDGKIFVNLPNYLNENKFISLVGCLDEYYNYFILDYILIYNNENERKNHILEISQNFNLFLNEIDFKDNYKQVNNNIYFTIIKYEKDNEENNNFINNDNNNIINIENNNIINNDNNNIIDNGIINKNKLIENFKSCPNIGLQNIGATCYMNATLQCFCHIEKFVEYFKYSVDLADIDEKNKNLLSTSFKILID